MLNTGTEPFGRLAWKWLVAHSLIVACVSNCIALEPKEVMDLPRSEVERALPASYPMAYYFYAGRLFKAGDKDDALFWYYVGELRYRFLLAATPNLPPDGAPALFASLHESIGSLVADRNQVAPATSTRELQRALDWDASNENGVTSKSAYRKEWLEVRAKFSQQIELANKAAGAK
jgi:hypothetical protein